ncbi:MAG: queuosine salvage family protein [Bacteroidales bacterium]|nr:queuosine salvage family protein [Bacteroidales bacterium]
MKNQSLSVNEEQCIKTGVVLKKLDVKQKFYERRFLKLSQQENNWSDACYFAVAICHQTHKLYHPILNLQGWNYLEEVFADFIEEENELIKPTSLAAMAVREIEDSLCSVFSHDSYPDHCALDRLGERAKLMHEAALFLTENFSGSFLNLLKHSQGYLFNRGQGLYEILEQINPYSDPLRKKSSFLIKLIQDAGIIDLQDPENYIPIVDYHMQRVLLRMGCIEVEDNDLRKKIMQRVPMESDKPFREAAIEAFGIIAEHSGHSLAVMNDFFWPLGRSCCHETTLCKTGFCSKNPCTFKKMTTVEDHTQCFFSEVCKGAGLSAYRKLWQPVVETHYY